MIIIIITIIMENKTNEKVILHFKFLQSLTYFLRKMPWRGKYTRTFCRLRHS